MAIIMAIQAITNPGEGIKGFSPVGIGVEIFSKGVTAGLTGGS